MVKRKNRKFKDGQRVWLQARIFRGTCVGYTVIANGGNVAGYVPVGNMKARDIKKK